MARPVGEEEDNVPKAISRPEADGLQEFGMNVMGDRKK